MMKLLFPKQEVEDLAWVEAITTKDIETRDAEQIFDEVVDASEPEELVDELTPEFMEKPAIEEKHLPKTSLQELPISQQISIFHQEFKKAVCSPIKK